MRWVRGLAEAVRLFAPHYTDELLKRCALVTEPVPNWKVTLNIQREAKCFKFQWLSDMSQNQLYEAPIGVDMEKVHFDAKLTRAAEEELRAAEFNGRCEWTRRCGLLRLFLT